MHLRVRGLRHCAVVLAGMVDERTRELARAKEDTEAALVTVEAQATQLRSLDEARSRFVANGEAAYGTGFKTVPRFTRRFKERFGTTPAAWREGA